MLLQDYSYVRIGTAVPEVHIADPIKNTESIIELIHEAHEEGIEVLTFPELSISSYSCSELFNQRLLLQECNRALKMIADASKDLSMLIVVGLPYRVNARLYNTAAVLHRGKVQAIVPKSFMPNTREFYEARWFSDAKELDRDHAFFDGYEVPVTHDVIFQHQESGLGIAVEICEDVWVPDSPGIRHAQCGANVIINLSSSNETAGKSEERRRLIQMRSTSQICAYVYSSSSHEESSSDVVFSGHQLIVEDGDILVDERFLENGRLHYADIDIERLLMERLKSSTFESFYEHNYRHIFFEREASATTLSRSYDPTPFIPKENSDEVFSDILKLQALGYMQRLKRTGIEKSLIGVSGGLDSTWALIVIKHAHEMLSHPLENIIAITMPGMGTSKRTNSNAFKLCEALGIPLKEIDITEGVMVQFKAIEHDPYLTDVTYENTQARERTQILMNMANKENGLVTGTGDLSEIALGWSTYNGDQMSMYNPNASIPKTLIQALCTWYGEKEGGVLKEVLTDIVGTPISPELLPTKEGELTQKTEELIGSYMINDFFLYHFVLHAYEPKKIIFLAKETFKNISEKELRHMLSRFYKRFITQQFKRAASPDGPKVTSISLSPKGDFKLPSDVSPDLWIRALED